MDKKISKGKIGVAGEYYVAAELSKLGYVASISLRNTKGIDILVSNEDGSKSRAIQVKTSSGMKKSWILQKKAEEHFSKNLFYVFVILKKENERPEFHIVPSKVVADYVRKDHITWLSEIGKNGKIRKDSDMRKFNDFQNSYLEKWDILELD